MEATFCNSLTAYSRFKTRVVSVGDLLIGGENPIRIQSMTTTDTMDTLATVEQSIRMIDAGCELVRITAPSIKEAENLANIKAELKKRGYHTPLVADIHFTPNAAEAAARIVEKVRVNPGNYADKKKFENIDYTEASYLQELERIRNKFIPLVRICKEYGTAMRIGTNHGSLSDRILSRFGDTPLGMVESALEFVRICEQENYHNIVLSMKASNPQIMVQAYRLLVLKMKAEGMNYPLHLGVTEAGEAEDGRIKSAVGIGTLLEDGLGDTIRVSLTEDPEKEIPVARMLVDRYKNRHAANPIIPLENPYTSFLEYRKRQSHEVLQTGKMNVPRVIISIPEIKSPSDLEVSGYSYSEKLDKWHISDQAADFIFTGDSIPDFALPGTLKVITTLKTDHYEDQIFPLLPLKEFSGSIIRPVFLQAEIHDLKPEKLELLKNNNNLVLVLTTENCHAMPEIRRAFELLMEYKADVPVIIKRSYSDIDADELMLYSATDFGALLTDGLGDGIWLDSPAHLKLITPVSFGILQATRTRISKTEYISCPSCGRTLFDLQETTARIRKVTDHLKGVKIGIMGCIVNGPGEMADADYGYVGTGIGKITLYRGREVVKKNLNAELAVNALIDLIKEDGRWVEKEEINAPQILLP